MSCKKGNFHTGTTVPVKNSNDIYNCNSLTIITTTQKNEVLLKRSYFKKASISKFSSLSPDRFGLSTSFPRENRRSTAALEGIAVL